MYKIEIKYKLELMDKIKMWFFEKIRKLDKFWKVWLIGLGKREEVKRNIKNIGVYKYRFRDFKYCEINMYNFM